MSLCLSPTNTFPTLCISLAKRFPLEAFTLNSIKASDKGNGCHFRNCKQGTVFNGYNNKNELKYHCFKRMYQINTMINLGFIPLRLCLINVACHLHVLYYQAYWWYYIWSKLRHPSKLVCILWPINPGGLFNVKSCLHLDTHYICRHGTYG